MAVVPLEGETMAQDETIKSHPHSLTPKCDAGLWSTVTRIGVGILQQASTVQYFPLTILKKSM